MLAGCASAREQPPARAVSPPVRLPLSISVSSAGTAWAVVDMGGPPARRKNVWELFARPAGSAKWKLATPGHIASNGGLVTSPAGPTAMAAGFLAGRYFRFSPVATTVDSGIAWSPGQPLNSSLAAVPDALASGPDGRVLALDTAGQVLSVRPGQRWWLTLTGQQALAATAAGRSCGLTAITAVAITPAGEPLVAGNCRKPGVTGIFTPAGKSWRLAGPALTGGGRAGPSLAAATSVVSVLRLASSPEQTMAVLRVSPAGGAADTVTTASLSPAGRWSTSAALRVGSAALQSVAVWAAGTAAVVLPGGRAAVLRAGAGWTQFGGLPAGTSTLAAGQGGVVEALVPQGKSLAVWQLRHGSFVLIQTIEVPSAHLAKHRKPKPKPTRGY
jgi:hypothetical protein